MNRIIEPLSSHELLQYKFYSMPDVEQAALILNTNNIMESKFDIKREELFRELSNFEKLDNPIYDEYNNEFRDSEGYYMAARTLDKTTKKLIAMMSQHYGMARKARKIFTTPLEMDEVKRVEIMRDAIRKKFDNNTRLQEILYTTGTRQIIEYTYWKDDLFGIDQEYKMGRNTLGKLLMEYRDLFLR